MPAPVVIRRAGPGDGAVVLRLHRALYLAHRASLVPEAVCEASAYRNEDSVLEEDARALLQDPRVRVLLAEANGKILGYITGRILEVPRRVLPRRGIIEDWYVEESARGAGVGRTLLARLLEHFRNEGCLVAESTTLPANTRARRAHEASGFTEIEVRYRLRL